jgi:murein L,D-transpeptidase YafK
VSRIDVDLSANWPWAKVSAGDRGVPEGRYRVSARKGVGATLYHRALLLDYPSQADLLSFRAAKRAGRLPASATIGGLIELHGEGGRGEDWTDGCVALANADMDALFARAAVDTPVTIVGATAPVDLLRVLEAREVERGR